MDQNLKKILWIIFSALLILFGGISALNHINERIEERTPAPTIIPTPTTSPATQ